MHLHEQLRRQVDRLRKAARARGVPEDGPYGSREMLRQAAVFEAEAFAAFQDFQAEQRAADQRRQDELARQARQRAEDSNRIIQQALDRQAKSAEDAYRRANPNDPRFR